MAPSKKPVAVGKQFEKMIVEHAKLDRVSCIRVPDEIRNFYNKTQKAIQVKTQFDFCLGVDGLAVFLDAKATQKSSFNFKGYLTNKKKIHQTMALKNAYELGNISGLLIWFYTLNVYTWAPINAIIELMSAGELGVKPDSKGVVSQTDLSPIRFRSLLSNEINEQQIVIRRRGCDAIT